MPTTLSALISDLAADPDYRHHGRTAIEGRVYGYAAAYLGTTPDHLTNLIADDTAQAVRDAFVRDEVADEDLEPVDDGPLPEVTADERAAWDAARDKARVSIRDRTQRIKDLRDQIDAEQKARDVDIRTARNLGVRLEDLAADAELTVGRVSQIGHNRR